jgi:hypothetical protein
MIDEKTIFSRTKRICPAMIYLYGDTWVEVRSQLGFLLCMDTIDPTADQHCLAKVYQKRCVLDEIAKPQKLVKKSAGKKNFLHSISFACWDDGERSRTNILFPCKNGLNL